MSGRNTCAGVARVGAIALGALVSFGCNMGDDVGKAERAAPAEDVKPSVERPRLEALENDAQPAPAPIEDLEAAAEASAEPAPANEDANAVTRSWFAGRWTDSGDCADAGEFAANGTYRLADGTRGMWNVREGRLVVQHTEGRNVLPVRRIDDDTVEVANEDGSAGRSRRCS